ncbi:2OG-Fe(II) oxygenase family protein [Acidisoma silvae]|uniref:2OG-Fe(II) oxygenase n=1 Tax=Acidisoma silvae TaxID=2802396 RepID=A0A963YMN4_9PROT|nr:2OG-Fe(II) oxygenase [Acidisoma silvae]MCB8873652.1 2OG-Fe(II) oxygenase [Acidisoma silvae]
MIDLDYQAFDATPVASDPYTHIVVENFVKADSLAAVVQELPKLSKGGSFPIDSLRFGPHAKELMEALEGPRFRAAVAKKFGLDLDGAPTMVTLRGASREKDGRIHCDSTTKRVTILLYLNPETEAWARREGCLRLLRGPDDIEDYVREVPPVNGTLLVFPNGPTTWHGHKQFVGQRYVIQLNYMTTDSIARSEMRRHKVSAFIKRLTSSAA